ncbi:MAG: hypothetical protein OXU69_04635 [Gemmatimonadota bacterium]|nr:hypothetical protein [Gemmatimonadota bacterium]MDE2983973.1 hypothetical protein [Gemmatimonadota bacterium]
MIARLVWASFLQRPGRSLLLLAGYALGVGVTIVLLSVGGALVEQARDKELVGGGDLIVLPTGIDLETLKTGGVGSMFFSIEQASLLYRQVLAGGRFEDRVAAAAPWIDDELLYLEADSGLVPISAGATIPGLAESLDVAPTLVAGTWQDLEADRRWRDPTDAELYRSLDALHMPAGSAARDSTWAEWHYFNVLLPDSGWLYLTYMIAGQVPDGRWGGRMLATRVRPGSVDRVYDGRVPAEGVTFVEGLPDLVIGGSSVTIEDDGSYTLFARIPSETGGAPLTVDLTVAAHSRRYLPPVEIGGEGIVSGYAVPLLDARASGRVCEGSRCRRIEAAQSYHDHNWGTWGGVTWDWGQAQAGGYSVLYGGVSDGERERGATGPRILYLADADGFAGIFSIRRLTTWRADGSGRTAPDSISILATSGVDSVALSIDVSHTRATPVPVWVDSPAALFFQMRGSASLSGRLRGTAIHGEGDGFFETWTRPFR